MLIEQYKQKYNIFGGSTSSGNLLTEYLDGRTISQGFSVDRGRTEFIEFFDRLYNNGLDNSKGFPQNLRKIAIANGSLTGSKSFKNFWETNSLDLRTQPIINNFAGNGSQTIKIKGFERNFWDMHLVTMEAYSMPSPNANHKISYFKKKKAFGWKYINTYINNINSRGNLDNVSGGWFKSLNDVASAITGAHQYTNIIGAGPSSNWVDWGISVNKWNIHSLKHVASFIPTASALAIRNPDFNWNNALGNRDLTCNNEIPFNNYYGEEINTAHTSLTQKSVTWLFAELDADSVSGPFPPPSVYLTNADLKGPSTLCDGETAIYYFEDCKVTGNIIWSVHQYLDTIGTPTNQSITVKPNTASQIYWVRAELEDGTIITKRINSLSSAQINITDINRREVISFDNLDFYSTTRWSVITATGGAYLEFGNNGRGTRTATARGYQSNWTLHGKVIVTNSCGPRTYYFHANDPCPNTLRKISTNRYKLLDCYGNGIPVSDTELYDIYGIKEQDIPPINNEIKINNAQSGTIKIIKTVTLDGNTKIKTIVID